jgi:hypothetical protein
MLRGDSRLYFLLADENFHGNCALDIERNDPIQSRSAQTDIAPSRKTTPRWYS